MRRCKLKPVQPVVKVPGFSSLNSNSRRMLQSCAFHCNSHHPIPTETRILRSQHVDQHSYTSFVEFNFTVIP